MKPISNPMISIIIPVKNEGNYVATTLESLIQSQTLYTYEVILVDDDSSDGCCDFLQLSNEERIKLLKTEAIGAAMARNYGANQAVGKYLIFCDAHLFFEDYWIDKLIPIIELGHADAVCPGIASTHTPDVVGYGQSFTDGFVATWGGYSDTLRETPILPGGCFAISSKVFWEVGGFEPRFHVWGYEDFEISFKLWLFGYTCFVQPQVKILHVFREQHPYQVTHEHVYYNLLRLAYSHFSIKRIEQCKQLVAHSNCKEIERQVLSNHVLEQRVHYFKRRAFDDDWFMHKFQIPF